MNILSEMRARRPQEPNGLWRGLGLGFPSRPRGYYLPALFFILLSFGSSFAQHVPCGFVRWPVKTLTDLDRKKVSFTPVSTTVAKLAARTVPPSPYPRDRRIAPEELTLYRVRARLLITLKHDSDSDLHLLLADPDNPKEQMIAEIPAPECAAGSGHEEEFRRARRLAQSLRFDTLVEIEGVGFFDAQRDLPVGASNGLELHPVLRVRVIGANAGSVMNIKSSSVASLASGRH